MTHENYTLSNQEQLNRFTNNTEIHENNILQDNRKCEEKCTKNILNKNVSDLMDIDDENYISTSSILASKEGNILLKKPLKRTLKEKDCNQSSKKMKLNRNSWLQSVAFKSSNYQQDNDSLSSVTTNTTVETNKTKKYNQEERPDLRKFLNQMKSEKSFKLKPTVEIANEEVCKKLSVKEESTLNGTLYEKKSDAQENPSSSVASDDEDDDCISLFAESFAEFDTSQCEDIFLNEKDKSSKSLHSDVPYTMTASSFDKYVKENNKEFNKEYAKCIKNDTESLKSDKANEISNNQSTQVLNTYCVPATAIQSKSSQIKNIYSKKKTLYDFIKGYCYLVLKCEIFQIINSEDTRTILDIMPEALTQNFNYFCEEVYIALLKKLNIDEILITYKMLYDNWNVNWRKEFTRWSRKNIASNIIEELLSRQISLKTIVDCMMTHILPTKNLKELNNILLTVIKYVKPGEYWNTTRNLILTLQSNVPKHIIDQILYECVRNKELQKIQDVNSNLISKLDYTLISTLNQYVMKCFKNMLVEKTAKNSEVLTQNFGESLITTETIASPDSPDPSINFTQQEPPIRYVSSINETDVNQNETDVNQNETDVNQNETDVNQNENHITQDVNVPKPYIYGFMQPIDAPYARSMYRDHERFWKFYMDLERFEKGLIHEDYNYIIDILKNYTEKRESELFVSKCCLILRNIKRSEYHLKNILTLTVQIGIFSILGKILLDIGLNILTSLVDEEAWGLALQFIQLLNIYNLPYNAKYFLLSAEIYLANNKAVKACDLLKYQNIICTSRDRWHVNSTINDEYVRNKIICILLDLFCNEFLEYAFFLFQFLLKDQSSYYNPIDLSRYVDKLIVLSLSKNDTNLITEMSNVILKHNFALSTTTCRALLSTIIHIDEVLARQIYNYAEGMGIYSTMKLLPIIHTIINTDLTEEEIYLIFLQLLKNLIMNFGHAIEFAKPREIKVYFILEIKTNKQFYCAELQSHYNNKAIMNAKALIKNVLKKRFDPPILLMKSNVKGRIGKLQSTSLINYLKSEHCN
ncbi:uncharacterized protein LOC105259189 [Camponotus floridanus]|uniref:uncharacterized protein LOC105259189 n=1 Tax=Camponotus floridanus TaxID=104421 RepID=UPI000DC6CD40|nr:uncharacterized protein LOC105259189 [Camponotus floridanus]